MRARRAFWFVFRAGLSLAWLASLALVGCSSDASQKNKNPDQPPAATVKLTSTAFEPGKPIPQKHTADGDDVSPPLAWSGLPEGTKELALICDDPDAPDPANPGPDPWVHWVIYKIPAGAARLPEAVPKQQRLTVPAGALQGANSWSSKDIGYRGPSPPMGRHRYFFKLYALDTELALEPGWNKDALIAAMKGHVLARGELMGTYER